MSVEVGVGWGGEGGVGRCSVCGTRCLWTRRVAIKQHSNEQVWDAQGVTLLAVAQM